MPSRAREGAPQRSGELPTPLLRCNGRVAAGLRGWQVSVQVASAIDLVTSAREQAMASETLHEDPAKLGPDVIDRHRAVVSLMEELEAVDWYDQRVKAASDDELRAILAHNRDEEKEHAAMVLEWLRRRDPVFSQQLRDYLFSEGSIVGREETQTGGTAGAAGDTGSDGSLGIGSLRAARE